jgi:hypothetical protein
MHRSPSSGAPLPGRPAARAQGQRALPELFGHGRERHAARAALEQRETDPAVRARLEANGAAVVASKSDEYARGLQSEIALTEKLMKVAGITAQ